MVSIKPSSLSNEDKLQAWRLKTGVFSVLFLLTVGLLHVTTAAIGDICSGSSECKEPEETCQAASSVCGCSKDYYKTDSGECQIKVSYGESCALDGPKDQCYRNTACVDEDKDGAVTCNCGYFAYFHPVGQECRSKYAHAYTCNASITDICRIPMECLSDITGQVRCLCVMNKDYYYNPVIRECRSLDTLKVLNIQADTVTEDNVTLTWEINRLLPLNITYEIETDSTAGQTVPGSANMTGGTVTGLSSGTQYNFTVTSVLEADSHYPEMRVSIKSSPVWTIPAKPGSVTSVRRGNSDNYYITFEESPGPVSYYTMTVNGEVGLPTAALTEFQFKSLLPGKSYNYSIIAYNGNGDPSEPFTGTLNTPVIASGPVELSISDFKDDGATITLSKPDEPNGDITGYTFIVTQGSTCAYGHRITCSDCPAFGVPGTLASCQRTGNEIKTSAELNDDTTPFNVEVSDLEPYCFYTIIANAYNFEGAGAPRRIDWRTMEAAPRFDEILKDYGVTSLVTQPNYYKTHETAIDVSVCASCLLDERQGKVTTVGLVVCKVGPDDECIDAGKKRRSLVPFEDIASWSQAKDQDFAVYFRPTPDDWLSALTYNVSYMYRIGLDANCQQIADIVYCNGPLPTNTGFRIAAIQCNSVGCVIGTFEGPFRTGAEESENATLMIALAIVFPVIIIILIIIVIIILMKRKMTSSQATTNLGRQDDISMAGLHGTGTVMQPRDDNEYLEPDPYDYICDSVSYSSTRQSSLDYGGGGQNGSKGSNQGNPYDNNSSSNLN